MAGIGKFFSEAAKLLYLGVGISDPGTIPRKIDLWKIATDGEWRVFNCSASSVNYKGKEAVRFDSREGEGLAVYEGLELSFCKIDLSIAAINQCVGVVFRAESEPSCEKVIFDVQAVLLSGQQKLKLRISAGSKSAEVELPPHLIDEWISARIVNDPQFMAVFINGSNMPGLKVPANEKTKAGGRIGLWVASNSEALIADLKYIQTRKRDFE